MNETQTGISTGRAAVIVILVAIVAAVVVTLLQHFLLGEARAAVTGGVVGSVTAVVALNVMKKRSSKA